MKTSVMRRWRRQLLRVGIFVFACATAVWLALPKPPLLDGVSFSQCVRDRNGTLLRVTLAADQRFRIYTPLHDISPELINATLRYEDKYYGKHPGVNPVALFRAAADLLRTGQVHSGGSTITMQVARLRFRLHTRSFPGKLAQIAKAIELERHYSKSAILEAYLNLAPYGRNIEGVGAATEIYFGKTPAQLSGPEAIALSVIPQSPARRALFHGRDNTSVNSAQNNWYDRAAIEREGEFSARAFRARAQAKKNILAPHFVRQVLETEKQRNQIATTLDLAKQQLIERKIAGYIAVNRSRGIENAAAMLVDFRTMDVLAHVGSADFSNVAINGQVDGTRSLRSPGSTLKPFVYALAMEQGLIHPLSILADAPHSFGEYNPENFDRDFFGPIRASDALARSRNIPAVALAAELSQPSLYEFLRRADVKLSQLESFYGLALPLGGGEVSMQDLVRLYAALANNGKLRALRRTLAEPIAAKGERILSPESTFLTLEMLGNVPRPEMTWLEPGRGAPVFWKTGTSHGFRDAWSVAIFDHYVLAVWIGNFDGRANPSFVGRSAAGPLLFQIVDNIRANWPEPAQPHLPPAGANLKRVEFCPVSGDLPGAHCRQRVQGWFIPGVSPIKTCDVHQEILVDVETGLRVAVDDGTRELRRDIYEFWPNELLALFERAGIPRKSPPPYLPGTTAESLARSGTAPEIVSPSGGGAREIIAGNRNEDRIPLRAKADADVREIYWFADKTFIGKTKPVEVLSWKSAPGHYELTALDDHGRAGSCKVTVR